MNLEQLLDQIAEAEQQDDRQVSLEDVLSKVGRRSFGPVLLIVGLITMAPLVGDIPGVPTMMAVIVMLTAVQLLLGREYFWLPKWLLNRSIASDKLHKALGWSRKPAQFIDRLLRQRLVVLAQGKANYAIAVVCLIIAAAMPLMEVVPFSANGAGIGLTAFGLALIARDGLLSLIAFISTTATIAALLYYFL
ncbi:exopolysaccharide biosynthesis protein [Saccharospirillum sp.]|uniref:exopolysaccharide biosynthesis protein n=1 Tax=Saccharospirillum sp. TaxID=2033801 RepID=UPI0034A06563